MTAAIAGQWLLRGLKAIWRIAATHPWQCAVLALLVASWQLWERGDRYRDKVAAMQAAQQTAAATQVAVNHVPAAKSAAIAEKSDETARAYYDDGRRAGLAYAAAHRLRDVCPTGGPDLPGTDRLAAQHDGDSPPAGMVAVSDADFDILVGNSLRLTKVHQDAEALIAAGVAVPSDPAP